MIPDTSAEALALGLKHWHSTGAQHSSATPCPRHHNPVIRATKDGACIACARVLGRQRGYTPKQRARISAARHSKESPSAKTQRESTT